MPAPTVLSPSTFIACLVFPLLLLSGCPRDSSTQGNDSAPASPMTNTDVFTAELPQVVIAEDGTAFVAYRERQRRGMDGATSARVRAFRYDVATGEDSDPYTGEFDSSFDEPLALDADDTGRAVLLHSALDRRERSTRACVFRTGAWRCSNVARGIEAATVALDGTAHAIALLQSSDTVDELGIDAAGTVRDVRALAGAVHNTLAPSGHLAFHPLGAGFAVIAAFEGNDVIARTSRYDRATDTWSAATTLEVLGARSQPVTAQLALDRDTPSAAPLAILLQANADGSLRIVSRQQVPGSGWAAAEEIPGSAGATAFGSTMSGDGSAFVAWVDASGAVHAQQRVGRWGALASTLGRSSTRRVVLAADDEGNAVAAWVNGGELFVARHLRGAGWDAGVTVAETLLNSDFDVAVDRDRAVLAFTRPGPDGGSRLVVRTLPLDFAVVHGAGAVFGGDMLTLTVSLGAPASTTTTVQLRVDDPADAPLSVPATVSIPAGAREASIEVATRAVTDFASVVIAAITPSGAETSQRLKVMPEPVLNLSGAATVASGTSLALDLGVQAAYPVPLQVRLARDTAAITLADSVDIPAGARHISAVVVGVTAGTATVTASLRASTARHMLQVTGDGSGDPGGGDPPQLTLYVQGTGTVTDTAVPARITCSGVDACTARFARGTTVQLATQPGAGQRFERWAGDEDCADGSVAMTADITCVANFASTAARWGAAGSALNRNPASVASFIDAPALRLAPDGRSTIAWREDDGVFVRRGHASTGGADAGTVDTIASNTTLTEGPALALDADGHPVVAYATGLELERDIHVRRFDGTAWVDVGPAPDTSSSADAFSPSLVVLDGAIVVAFAERDGAANNRILVRRWDGANWQPVGTDGGPAVTAGAGEATRPLLVLTGSAANRSLAVMWAEDGQVLRVAELAAGAWTTTASPFASAVQAERADIMWTADLGLVVAAAPAAAQRGRIDVRHLQAGGWLDLGSPRGDANAGSFLLAVAFSHGSLDSTPLLAYAVSRSRGAQQDTRVERYENGSWTMLGTALPMDDRQGNSGSPRAVAVADHAQPLAAVVLQGNLPGSITSDHTLMLYRFE